MIISKKRLPSHLSKLIRLAIKNLEECEEDPNYEIDMGEWHSPQDDGPCQVCLGGAVLAKTLNVPISEHIDISVTSTCDTVPLAPSEGIPIPEVNNDKIEITRILDDTKWKLAILHWMRNFPTRVIQWIEEENPNSKGIIRFKNYRELIGEINEVKLHPYISHMEKKRRMFKESLLEIARILERYELPRKR